jgi:aminopeptidase-like protein
MGKRGLYPTLSTKVKKSTTKSYMNFLQYADGNNSLEKISKIINLNDRYYLDILKVVNELEIPIIDLRKKLLKKRP